MYDFEHTKGWMEWVNSLAIKTRVDVWRRFYQERFALIIEDLEELRDEPIIVEGVELFPEYVFLHSHLNQAAWLVPTRSFFEQHYYTRPWITEPPSDKTWLYYEVMVEHIRTQVRCSEGTLIEADGHISPEEIATTLAGQFGLC